jgi:hypothetical protein
MNWRISALYGYLGSKYFMKISKALSKWHLQNLGRMVLSKLTLFHLDDVEISLDCIAEKKGLFLAPKSNN